MRNPGKQIRLEIERLPKTIIQQFEGVPAANIADITQRLFGMDMRIQPMGIGQRLCGCAVTVKSAMADNFMFHKALTIAKPGDVIVVDCSGDLNQSVCGDVMYRYAIRRGIAGFVVNGCVRDLDFLQKNDFPVYAMGATPRGPYKSPVGEINFDICCGGQVVHPGDLILGDSDGITVVRREDALTILEKLPAKLKAEEKMGELIANNRWELESPIFKEVSEKLISEGFSYIE